MDLTKTTFNNPNILIFHGKDRDSVLAFRALLYMLTAKSENQDDIDELVYFPISAISHLTITPSDQTSVFVIGPTPYINIQRLVENFQSKNIFWFCNEATSVQVAQANDIGNKIQGMRTTISGLTLVDLIYLYMYTTFRTDAHGTIYDKENPDTIYNELDSSELMLQFPESLLFLEKYRTSLFFQGKILSEPEDYQIKQIEQWIEHISKIDPVLYEYADDFIDNNNRGMENFFEPGPSILATSTYLGSILFSNISREYMNVYKESAFSTRIKKFPQYSVVAINYSRATKDIFLYGVDDYELGLLFWYDGMKMNYEIYRLGSNPNKFISCKTIAEAFGGHGSTDKGRFFTFDSTLVFER